MGQRSCPALIWTILAAWLTSWSKATKEKFQVMNSTMGRSPTMAAPMPTPEKPYSLMGVSTTRRSPNSSSSPSETL